MNLLSYLPTGWRSGQAGCTLLCISQSSIWGLRLTTVTSGCPSWCAKTYTSTVCSSIDCLLSWSMMAHPRPSLFAQCIDIQHKLSWYLQQRVSTQKRSFEVQPADEIVTWALVADWWPKQWVKRAKQETELTGKGNALTMARFTFTIAANCIREAASFLAMSAPAATMAKWPRNCILILLEIGHYWQETCISNLTFALDTCLRLARSCSVQWVRRYYLLKLRSCLVSWTLLQQVGIPSGQGKQNE